jgi:hypothetical protein
MPIILAVANLFGISVFRLAAYAAVAAAITVGAITIRQHYVNKGYKSAIEAVKKQDQRAVDAATKVEQKATVCTEQNGYWDVITQGCKLEDAE